MRMEASGRGEYFLAHADAALKWRGNELYNHWSKIIRKALSNDESSAVLGVRGKGVTMEDAYIAIGVLVTKGFIVKRWVTPEGLSSYLVEW